VGELLPEVGEPLPQVGEFWGARNYLLRIIHPSINSFSIDGKGYVYFEFYNRVYPRQMREIYYPFLGNFEKRLEICFGPVL
jgi:hypothetical protein